MNKNNKLDSLIKSAMDDSANNIKASKDIFNDAWNKKEQGVTNMSYFKIKNIKRAALITACCAAFSIVGVFTISPEVRAATKEALRTIFVLDKSDNDAKVVKKSEDEIIEQHNIGGVAITDSNKNEMEKSFGFAFNFPEKIGEYSTESFMPPRAGISIYDIKYKDIQDMKDKFMKAIDDDKTFEELKDYNMRRYVHSLYVDNQGHEFLLSISKYNPNSKMNLVKEVNINNIKCRVVEKLCPEYNKKINGNYMECDMTKEPTSVDKNYYIKWNYDDIKYSIYIGENSPDFDAAIQFAEDYIKILKQS
ncbi:hypothetical protein FDA09_01885 [Clostridium botulinum]|uniref:hypothetical protein n=1 Tax=Clostridium botulinum TaxID=1491 RepID=UPI000773BC50|nr:hypothetical protein [Clostridium botulinum]MBN1043142.1 hypothetical protein [Clostridium botulinum]MBN1062759.1 hypothetical protein [Clostridium botulinum]NFH79484.1 hypothetical protein [Clostridium botulinum]NFH82167.1 hypothetical protein [Clostridium botulinum]NFI10141.1 hypothetical protein [Clostridium botulinum]